MYEMTKTLSIVRLKTVTETRTLFNLCFHVTKVRRKNEIGK